MYTQNESKEMERRGGRRRKERERELTSWKLILLKALAHVVWCS
jgi:hypothetical protein